ncbi:DUF1758 domain-containing protein [Trichonephila clavipes]|uniref:DUF1758 domain-containing protein n=1 Tax=Trichonephila clavipes TaxID=2585209 RepID=A0A8X6SUC8_TRICX|nr:DUF1758 domain-containing protein [Trichonephila clavipes]
MPNETHVQLASRSLTNWDQYCNLRNVNDFNSLKELIVSDKLYETLDNETAVHINIKQEQNWFKSIQMGKECDMFYACKGKSFSEFAHRACHNQNDSRKDFKYIPPNARREKRERSAVLENITRIPSTKMIHKNTAMSTKAKSLVVNSKKITVKPCILCRNSHPLYKCIAFQNMSVECRKKFVTNNKLCINCLRLHYDACMSKYKCTVSGCKGLHNSLLHDSAELCSAVKNHTVGERGIESNSNPTRFEGQPEVAVLTYGNKCVLLNTFMIFVKSADGYRIKLRGLLDNASTICVMREDIARKLGFKFKSANQSITGINGITQSSKYSANIEVSNRDYTFARNVQFSLLPKITDAIPVSKLNISDLNIPASIELADSNFHMPVTGTLPQSQQQANCCLISEPSLDITVKKFFELESLPDDSKEITKSEEEIYCEEHFVSTYKRDKTGRFIVRLPIKENAETLLGYSKENAIKRLNGIWEKLNKNNTMGTLYKEFMNEYELLGHMEEIKMKH